MENERSSYNELCVVHVTASSLGTEWQRVHDLQQSLKQELFWNCVSAAYVTILLEYLCHCGHSILLSLF